jgi:glycosyltransferase involved in cell wall biosynthesis
MALYLILDRVMEMNNPYMKYKVVYYIESTAFGGAEHMLFNLLRGLDRDMWEPVLVYKPHPGVIPLIDRVKGIEISALPTPSANGPGSVNGGVALIRMLRMLRPRVFHAHLISNLWCSSGIICAYLAGIKTIIATQHSFQEPRARRIRKLYALKFYQKLVSMLVDKYIAVSERQATGLRKAVISESKVEVIHNGINVEDFSHKSTGNLFKSVLTDNAGKPVVLTVARMDRLKGHRYLLEAAASIPEAVFVLAGDGPERTNLENLAAELGISDRVIFLGRRDDVPELLSDSDLFVLPSLLEGLSLSVLEAMASSKPVITTDIPGMDEIIVNDRSGIMVPPEDPEALARKIKQVLSDAAVSNRIAAGGRQRVIEQFSAEKMVSETSQLYLGLIENRPENAK